MIVLQRSKPFEPLNKGLIFHLTYLSFYGNLMIDKEVNHDPEAKT